ncbi:MAG TPA: PqqD family protein [Fibrobacteria bacterium]|nr:PqqD family protein [Fibrobacteria bacterium]
MPIASDSVFARNADLLSTDLEDAVVFLDVESGDYLRLSGSARVVWGLLESPCTFERLVSCLVEHYGIDTQVCRRDTEPFLEELVRAKIVVEVAREGA